MPEYSGGKAAFDHDTSAYDVTFQTGFKRVASLKDPDSSAIWVYDFYIESGRTLVYRKSIDGGATYAAATTIDGAITTYSDVSVWFQRWTDSSDQTSNLIHIVASNTGNNELRYFQLDTDDTDAIAPSGGVSALSDTTITADPMSSVCVGYDGKVYVCGAFSSTLGIQMASAASPSAALTTWADRGVVTGADGTDDRGVVVPVLTDNDVCVFFIDVSGTETLEVSRWDAVGEVNFSNSTLITDTDLDTDAFSVVHDPDNGDVYIVVMTQEATSGGTPAIFTVHLYDESAGTSSLLGDHTVFENNSSGYSGSPELALDTSNKTLFLFNTVGHSAALAIPAVKMSYDLGVSWGSNHRLTTNIGDDLRFLSSSYHLIVEANGLHLTWQNDDTQTVHSVSYVMDRIGANVVDNGGTAASGVDAYVFLVHPTSGFERYYMGRAITDGSGDWAATILDIDNDNIEVQVLYDEDLANDEVDASHRLAVDSF